jgi:hypothetical protein
VTFKQLLSGERRTEVRVMLAHQRQDRALEGLTTFAIARPTALTGNQRRRPIRFKRTAQAENLAPANAHQRGSRIWCEPTIREADHHTQPAHLPIAHLDHRHRTLPRTRRRQIASVTFLSGTGVTFLTGLTNECRRRDIMLSHECLPNSPGRHRWRTHALAAFAVPRMLARQAATTQTAKAATTQTAKSGN